VLWFIIILASQVPILFCKPSQPPKTKHMECCLGLASSFETGLAKVCSGNEWQDLTPWPTSCRVGCSVCLICFQSCHLSDSWDILRHPCFCCFAITKWFLTLLWWHCKNLVTLWHYKIFVTFRYFVTLGITKLLLLLLLFDFVTFLTMTLLLWWPWASHSIAHYYWYCVITRFLLPLLPWHHTRICCFCYFCYFCYLGISRVTNFCNGITKLRHFAPLQHFVTLM